MNDSLSPNPLVIDFTFVGKYAEQYRQTHTKECNLETTLKAELATQDHVTMQQLLHIAEWKAPRIKGHIRRNNERDIHEVSRLAFTSTNERIRIQVLQILTGVNWPMASTILHFKFPEHYTVLDFRALWTLDIPQPSSYTFEFWMQYNQRVINEAKRLQVKIRELDMALWMYSKDSSEH